MKAVKTLLGNDNGLFSKLAKTKCLVQTSEGQSVRNERLCILEIGIICPVADDNIIAGQVNGIVVDDVVPCIDGDLGVQLESAELEQQGNPVQDGMIAVQQVQYLQPVRVKGIAVDKSVCTLFAGPLTSHLVHLCAVEAHAIVLVGIANMNIRNLNDVVSSVKQLDDAHKRHLL